MDNNILIELIDIDSKYIKKSLDDLVKNMILKNIKKYYEYEMYKVLALLYRTKIVRCLEDNKVLKLEDFIVNEEYIKEKYGNNTNKYLKMIENAINETRDLIIVVNNIPIDIYFHDICGGSTENSENVIKNKVNYLRKVLCNNCRKSKELNSEKEFTIEELEEKLNVTFPKNESIEVNVKDFFEDIKKNETGRVDSLKIGGKEFKGKEIVKLLNINSTRFSIYPKKVIIKTIGKGHGLGVCLYGANEMARNGHSYREIINYYYTGVEIKELLTPCIKKPLMGKSIIVDPGHGGKNSNDNVGKYGTREKDIVLEISLKLYEKLSELGADVKLTRNTDEFIPLKKRVELSKKIRPDIFLSIHLNTFSNEVVRGCEIYHYKNDKEASLISNYLMKSIQEELSIPNKGIKTADLFLLREVGVTCIHLEIDYISNPEIEIKLQNKKYVEKIANCIKNGILNYYKV